MEDGRGREGEREGGVDVGRRVEERREEAHHNERSLLRCSNSGSRCKRLTLLLMMILCVAHVTDD